MQQRDADPIDEGKAEIAWVVQMREVAGEPRRPVNFLMMTAIQL